MDSTHRRRVVAGPDRAREYTEAQEKRLAANLWVVARQVRQGAFSERPIDSSLLEELHAELFDSVRDHGGRIRSADFGSETLTFGPNRSLPRDQVPTALRSVFDDAVPLIRNLEGEWSASDYEIRAIHIAVWLHARIIEIHPFEDGNGRTCRQLLDVILVRLGLRPVPIEVPKEEYREALNHFYRTQDMEPLSDLFIRLLSTRS